ncbi:MAG: hypothetical protein JSS49_16090 [Planctomycetes bacterium]|nr:hypothetical protein [Planctomycetota bacterium]
MGQGILSLLLRSLRTDSRSLLLHLAWLGLSVGIYVSLCMVIWGQRAIGAPGLGFLRNVAYLDAAILYLLGTPFFAGSIAEERDEGTLGLMRMAGLGSLGILLGKSIGRLVQVLVLMAIQLPFWWLSVTLGGVTSNQLWLLAISLFAFVVALAGIATACSVVCSSTQAATVMTSVVLAIHLLAGFVEDGIGSSQILISTSIWQRISDILATGSNESTWSVQVVSNLVAGFSCYVLSWLLFGTLRDEIVAGKSPLAIYRAWKIARPMAHRESRVWGLSCTWKDFQFVLGGWPVLLLRMAFYVGLFLAAGLFNFQSLLGGPGGWGQTHASFQFALIFAIPFDAGLLFAAALQSEIRGQTLSLLVMLPRQFGNSLGEKFLGILPGVVPGISAFVLSCLAEPRAFFHSTDQFVVLTSWMISIPFVAAVLSTFLRWGAAPLALALMFGGLILLDWLLFRTLQVISREFTGYCVGFGYLLLCGVCVLVIMLRLVRLASR